MYVDFNYYKNTYRGTIDDVSEFNRTSERASEIIDNITMYRIQQNGLSSFSELHQTLIKKSVCAQIDYIESLGGVDSLNEINMGSVSLGKFSYSGNSNKAMSIECPQSKNFLMLTGLLYRGIDVLCNQYRNLY